MPKEFWHIKDFSKGVNDNADPRDLRPGELVKCENMIADRYGKLRNMGTGATQGIADHAATLTTGYGLFFFSTDRDLAGNEDGEDWIALMDAASSQIDLYDRDVGVGGTPGWTLGAIDLGTTPGMKPCFFVADGALRVSDGNFGAANKNKWRGYIERTHFEGLTPGGVADDYDDWYTKDNDLAKPTRGIFGQYIYSTAAAGAGCTATNLRSSDANAFSGMDAELDLADYIAYNHTENLAVVISARVDDDDLTTAAVADWTTDTYSIYPAAGAGFNIDVDPTGTDGTWVAGDYEIAVSFIYDGIQESLLFKLGGDGDRFAVTANNHIVVRVLCTSPFDPRITGGHVYIRKYASNDSWALLTDISLKDGLRTTLTAEFLKGTVTGGWVGAGVGNNQYLYAIITSYDPNIDTYESINGFSQNEVSIDIGQTGDGYKTAVVMNRTSYVGNVKRTNEDGKQVVEGDAIYKSAVNRFDTYPASWGLEAATRDGESIVKLAGYADRILEFKKRTLRIINASQELEYIESTHWFHGVSHPAAVVETEFGIAWANEQSCYLYNGERIIDLLRREGKRVLSKDTWTAFITDNAIIGYHPPDKLLFVLDDCTTSSGGDVWIFDMIGGGWFKGIGQMTGGDQTNFATDWNNDLIFAWDFAGSLAVRKWDNSPDPSPSVEVIFPDVDFEEPGLQKQIYGVVVTYKSSVVDATPFKYKKIDASGESTSWVNFDGGSFAVPNPPGDGSIWVAEQFTIASPPKVQSFRPRLDVSANGLYEINDIAIVYRLLPNARIT